MKKFLTLVAVLAVASMANAAVVNILANGASSVNVAGGTEVTITVVADFGAAQYYGSYGIVGKNNAGTAALVAGGLGVNAGFTGTKQQGYVVNALGTGTNASNWMLVTVTSGQTVAGDPGVAAGQALYTFKFTAPTAAGAYTIQTMTGNSGRVAPPTLAAPKVVGLDGTTTVLSFGSATINVVPEPMTLALLGLGGLFIRRK